MPSVSGPGQRLPLPVEVALALPCVEDLDMAALGVKDAEKSLILLVESVLALACMDAMAL